MAKIKDNNRWLHWFMKQNSLSRRQVADAVCVAKSTVDRWLLPPPPPGRRPTNSYRKMPDMARKLLTYMKKNGDFDNG